MAENLSCDSKDHSKHMCALIAQGLDACITLLSDKPVVECKHCGAKANSSNNVCAVYLGASNLDK